MTPLPGVLKTLGEGCNLAAEKAYLMLLPILLDLFLLFGPKLRIGKYLKPYFEEAFKQMSAAGNASAALEASKDLLMSPLDTINLFGLVRTTPIGVSVLFSAASSETPLGMSKSVELTSLLQIIPLIGVMLAIGVLLGTFYYAINGKAAAGESGKLTLAVFGKQLLSTVLLYVALVIAAVFLSVPISCLLTITLMTFPILYQILTLVLVIVGCWLLIPLFYTPHGIFVKNMDLIQALKESFRMASWSSMVTIRFILFSVVLTFGLDMVWGIPQQSSWLILISIFGHAYVSTALLCGSFILYRKLQQWKNENRQFIEWRKSNLRFKQIFKKGTRKQ